MKIIALEEHFQNAAIEEAVGRLLPAHQRDSAGKFLAESINSTTLAPQLEDLGTERLKHMDAMGIDVQVLSSAQLGLQVLPSSHAIPLPRQTNHHLPTPLATHLN